MKTIERQTATLEYLRYFLTKLENLISLNVEYRNEQVPPLIKHINKNKHGCSILFKRIGYNPKTLYGKISDITENGFNFISHESFDNGGKFEQPIKNYIRFDNVLGWIPFCPPKPDKENNFNPFTEHICPETENYFNFLKEIKDLLEKCTKTKHKASIYLRYPDESKEIIDCEIIEVNKSNVLVLALRSRMCKKGEVISVDLTKTEKNILYISTKNYLQKCEVTFGVTHNINERDDMEYH